MTWFVGEGQAGKKLRSLSPRWLEGVGKVFLPLLRLFLLLPACLPHGFFRWQ